MHRTAHTRRHSPNNGATNQVIFPSAMSRYLVSNRLLSLLTICHSGFHPLCRGTWFPTRYKSHVRSACFRFHPLCRGTWFPTTLISVNKKRTKECFHPLCRGTWFPTTAEGPLEGYFGVSIRYVAVLGFQLRSSSWATGETSVSIRYVAVLGFQPYLKNAPSDQRRRKRFTHPRRIDHIPTFASLNHDKNTRSTHYTPNAGIELSETTPPPLRVNPVQK